MLTDGKLAFTTGASLPVPPRFRSSLREGQKVTFGLRPDDIYPSGHGRRGREIRFSTDLFTQVLIMDEFMPTVGVSSTHPADMCTRCGFLPSPRPAASNGNHRRASSREP